MKQAREIVDRLNDNQVIMMTQHIHDEIFGHIDYHEMEKHVADEETEHMIAAITDSQLDTTLNPQTSVHVARRFLESLADDDNLSPLVLEAWQQVRNDDGMFIAATIAVGLMINLTLFMISSRIELQIGGLKITKDRVDTEAVKAVMAPVSEAIKLAS